MLDNFFTDDVITSDNRNALLLKDTDSIMDGGFNEIKTKSTLLESGRESCHFLAI